MKTSPSRPAPPPDHVARVLSEHVQKLVLARLKRLGIAEQDREDYQQTVTTALVIMANPPEDLDGCSKAAHVITGNIVAGERRKTFRRSEVNAGLTDQADHHSAEDARDLANGQHAQKLVTLDEAMDDGTLSERDAQMLAMKREGFTDAQIAEKLGVKQQTVSNRLATVRKMMREKWQARAAKLAGLAFVVLLAILVWRKREEVAHFFRTPAPQPAPTHSMLTPEPSIPVATRADELRGHAAEACASGDYEACSNGLEAAAKLDPAGETQPKVRALRHLVEDQIRPERSLGAKPGYPR
jgi:RNA polymerase sigma factor (sigma-70 family)